MERGDYLRIGWVYKDCQVVVGEVMFEADKISLNLVELDVILGMDFLEKYRALVDCYKKEVTLTSWNGLEVISLGERDIISTC